jgi:hypothetical protein
LQKQAELRAKEIALEYLQKYLDEIVQLARKICKGVEKILI